MNEKSITTTAKAPRPSRYLTTTTSAVRAQSSFSSFENWPMVVFYAPLLCYWAALAVRYRSTMLPTAANPALPLGGMCGESKSLLLRLLGDRGRAVTAPYCMFTRTTAPAATDIIALEAALTAADLHYPLVAKPDIGRNGTGVQVVRDRTTLTQYLDRFPQATELMLQAYVAGPGEASIFYVRRADQANGYIPSLTLKHFPTVRGDGVHTVRELILRDPRARQIADLYLSRFNGRAEAVPDDGATVSLVSVGNHCKGAIFEDGAAYITETMTATFDAIAKEIPDFHYGRFDVRFTTLDALKAGTGFTILEYNGVSSEPTHIWDRHIKLADAYRAYRALIKEAFVIGNSQRAGGHRPASLLTVLKELRREQRLLNSYPAGVELM